MQRPSAARPESLPTLRLALAPALAPALALTPRTLSISPLGHSALRSEGGRFRFLPEPVFSSPPLPPSPPLASAPGAHCSHSVAAVTRIRSVAVSLTGCPGTSVQRACHQPPRPSSSCCCCRCCCSAAAALAAAPLAAAPAALGFSFSFSAFLKALLPLPWLSPPLRGGSLPSAPRSLPSGDGAPPAATPPSSCSRCAWSRSHCATVHGLCSSTSRHVRPSTLKKSRRPTAGGGARCCGSGLASSAALRASHRHAKVQSCQQVAAVNGTHRVSPSVKTTMRSERRRT